MVACRMLDRRAAVWFSLLAVCFGVSGGCEPYPRRASRPGAYWPSPLSTRAYSEYIRGRIAVIEGDYSAAIDYFRDAASQAPDEALIHVALIDALQRDGQIVEAKHEAKKARKTWPYEPDVWFASGILYHATNQPDDRRRAIKALRRAVRLDRWKEPPYLALGLAYVADKQPKKAFATYKRLTKRVPTSVTGHFEVGRRLVQMREYRAAEPYLRQVLALQFGHIDARLELATVMRATDRKAEAIDLLQDAYKQSGRTSIANTLFMQLLDISRRADAVRLLDSRNALKLKRRERLELGEHYLHIGEFNAAARVARSLFERTSASGRVRLLEARAHAAGGHVEPAIASLLEVSNGDPAYAACRVLAARLLSQIGKRQIARRIASEAYERDSLDEVRILGFASIMADSGDLDRARVALRSALMTFTNHPTLTVAYARLLDRQGEVERAIRLLDRLVRARPEHVPALMALGSILTARREQLPRAERLLARAVDLSPGDPDALTDHGLVLLEQGRVTQARAAFDRALAIHPFRPDILYQASGAYLNDSDSVHALALLQRALSSHPDVTLKARILARQQALSSGKK